MEAKITVNAFLIKCFALSQRRTIKDLNCGKRYSGNSIINGAVPPFCDVCLINKTQTIAVIIPTTYIEYVIRSTDLNPKASAIPPAIATKIGSFAPQEKNGITLIVAVLSLSSASVRVLTIAGTEQPNPIIIGMNALPDKPKLRNILSKIKATRAIYPVSSMMAKNKNNTKICGKKPKIANKPAKAPSQTKLDNQAGAPLIQPSTSPVNQPKVISKALKSKTPGELIPPSCQIIPSQAVPANEGVTFLNNPPKNNKFSENVKWKIVNKITAKSNKPNTLCVKTLSILSDLLFLTFCASSSFSLETFFTEWKCSVIY